MKYSFLFFFIVTTGFAQQTDIVDFKSISATITPKATSESVLGNMKVSFQILRAVDSVYLDAVNMEVTNTALESMDVRASTDKIWLIGPFQKDKEYTAYFEYEALPIQTLYFTGNQIWTQGQGKYTSHWLPSIDDMNDKIEFDLTIVASPDKSVVANGKLIAANIKNQQKHWQFDMKHPMSSYLVAFAVGDFKKQRLNSTSGIPIELYLSQTDTLNFEPTYRYTKAIFDFFETEIGVPYPWQNYKQVPVRDFLYAGMENTTVTLFSEAFVVDSTAFIDRNYVNVNAHELAHQWFGNLITETSGTHHWLQEGFATYYAFLAERSIFGDEYYYWKLYQTAEQLKALSDEGKGESLLNANASSLTFYEKGAWALHMLRELIGDADFKIAVVKYLEKNSFKNVSTDDFLNEVRNVTDIDISAWEKDWLQQSAFKAEQAFNSLLKSDFMNDYFDVSRLGPLPLAQKKAELMAALTNPNDFIGQDAIYQLLNEPIEEATPFYEQAFESDNLMVRQAIALSLQDIPESLQTQYETLLDDASYATQEAALYGLWGSFPNKRATYLDRMDGVVGFQDKNVRQLWLALAIVTPNYKSDAKAIFRNELKGYTSPSYSFEIRQKAFQFINEIQQYDASVIDNLIDAAVHHNWRFRTFARNLLTEVLKNPGTKEALFQKLDSFSEAEKNYLLRIK